MWRKKKTFSTAGGTADWSKLFEKQYKNFSKKTLRTEILFNLAMLPLGIYLQKIQISTLKKKLCSYIHCSTVHKPKSGNNPVSKKR